MLKLTYGKAEFQKFSGGGPPDPPLKGSREEGKGRAGEGRGEIRLGGIVLQLRVGSGIRAV